jgi:hypothetical protein
MSDPDTPPSHRIRSGMRSLSPVQEMRHQYELLILKHTLQRTLSSKARPQQASSSRPRWNLTNALHWVKNRLTRSRHCTPAVSTSGTVFKSMASTRATSRRVTDRGGELESLYASCHDSESGRFRDLCPLDMTPFGSREMESCETETCPSDEEVMGSRQPGIEDNSTCVSALSRVDSSLSMAAYSLEDWELLDDPTLDYYHLFPSPGRRQAKEFNSALLALSSFTLPPMFVLLRTLCLHLMKKERNLRLLHGKSRRCLETRFSMHVRVSLEQMHCNNWKQTKCLLQCTLHALYHLFYLLYCWFHLMKHYNL